MLGDALGEEFEYRREKRHASSLVIAELRMKLLREYVVNVQRPTTFVLAMPEHLRPAGAFAKPSVAVERYQAYYNECKQGFWRQGTWVPATWGKRDVPEWFVRAPEPREEVQ